MEKLLELAAIKLSWVVSDLHGVTGRDIMDHPIAGVRDPKALAQLTEAIEQSRLYLKGTVTGPGLGV